MQICVLAKIKSLPPPLIFTAPSSAPENLKAVAIMSTSISLTWTPPPEGTHNGMIRHYTVNITEDDSERELVFYSPTTSLMVSSLHPYYTYHCRVSAITVEYGPYTDILTVTTREDGWLHVATLLINSLIACTMS